MNVDELATQYYDAILIYEDYLKDNKKEINLDNYSEVEKEIFTSIYETVNEMYEKRYTPWRSLDGDILDNLKSIFSEGGKNILSYIAVCDGVGGTLTELTEEELKKYYLKQGKTLDDYLENKIIEEAVSLHLKEQIDKKIYSEEVLKLHFIARKFDDVCDKLFKFYQEQSLTKNNNESKDNLINSRELKGVRKKHEVDKENIKSEEMEEIEK